MSSIHPEPTADPSPSGATGRIATALPPALVAEGTTEALSLAIRERGEGESESAQDERKVKRGKGFAQMSQRQRLRKRGRSHPQ
jgi:hypothetical protein